MASLGPDFAPRTPSQPLAESRQVEPHPRPAKRVRASQGEWSDIHQEFDGACCVHCGLPHQSLHHIVPRSQGGDDVYLNLAPMCGDGTRGCHGLIETHAPGWERVAASMRVYVLTHRARCVYVIGKIGWERFNSRYPLLSEPGEAGAVAENRGAGSEGPIPAGEGDSRTPNLITPGSESDWDRYEEPVWRYRPPGDESEAVEGWEKTA